MKWILNQFDPDQVAAFSREILGAKLADSVSAGHVARLLLGRGIADAEAADRFFHPRLQHLHSPSLMRGMREALDRVEAAIERKERILVYGDYDVDGTTAIVILKTAIEMCGGTADYHVPHRIREGYDLREDVIERCAEAGVKLVISVDAGIRAFAAAETARRVNIDLIVTDHHLPGPDGVPRAFAVINPNQSGCDYPEKTMCGAAVAFKLAQALLERRCSERDQARLALSFLKMVAIATIADSVPLRGENRVFASLGLAALKDVRNAGLKALLETAQVAGKALTSTEVGFRVAPRINAAGRMDVASDVIELFTTSDTERARSLAEKLDRLNSQRRQEEQEILQSIFDRIEGDQELREAFCLVVDGKGWHRGVIGITAYRVLERYGRPTIVISCDEDVGHGSGRSIHAFHLLEALESCSGLFTRFGGHSHAAGFSLPVERVPALRKHLQDYSRSRLTAEDLLPILKLDGELPLGHITPEWFATVERFQPFGMGNPEPAFICRSARLAGPVKIIKDKHAKLMLRPRSGAGDDQGSRKWTPAVCAMGWNLAEQTNQAKLLSGDSIDIAFTLDTNDHPEFGGLELRLRDFVPST